MKNKINTAKQAKDLSSTLREMAPHKKANGKYTYLHGLAIGGKYYFKLKIQLTSNFGGRSIFYSHQDTISLSSSTKLFKDDVSHVGGNSRARVFDIDGDGSGDALCDDAMGMELDNPSFGRELDGVGNQVVEDLLNFSRIGFKGRK